MRPSILLTILLALPAWIGVTGANVPDCLQCTIDPPAKLGRSPKNFDVANPFQYTLRFTLRNEAGVPIYNWPRQDITLDVLAPCQNPFAGLNPTSVLGATMIWDPIALDRPGGSCTGPNVVRVRIISLNCDRYLNAVTSPDEDGDAQVALADLAVFQQAFVTGGPPYQGDLNLSGGAPDLGDLSFFQRHFVAP
jgi:hypothetical protein